MQSNQAMGSVGAPVQGLPALLRQMAASTWPASCVLPAWRAASTGGSAGEALQLLWELSTGSVSNPGLPGRSEEKQVSLAAELAATLLDSPLPDSLAQASQWHAPSPAKSLPSV